MNKIFYQKILEIAILNRLNKLDLENIERLKKQNMSLTAILINQVLIRKTKIAVLEENYSVMTDLYMLYYLRISHSSITSEYEKMNDCAESKASELYKLNNTQLKFGVITTMNNPMWKRILEIEILERLNEIDLAHIGKLNDDDLIEVLETAILARVEKIESLNKGIGYFSSEYVSEHELDQAREQAQSQAVSLYKYPYLKRISSK